MVILYGSTALSPRKLPGFARFRKYLKLKLRRGEQLIAYGGYQDDECVLFENVAFPEQKLFKMIRARHEIINCRMKKFNVLHQTFRHRISMQGTVFFSVANVIQVSIANHEPMFSVLD